MARCGATETCTEAAYLDGLCKRHHDAAWYGSRGRHWVTAAEARWPHVTCAKCNGSGQGDGPGDRCTLCNGDGYRVPDGDTLVRSYRPKRALRTANYWAVPSTDSGTAVRYDQFVANSAFNYLAADLLARAVAYKTPPTSWWNDPPEAGTWFPITPRSFLGAVRWQVRDNPYQGKRRQGSNVPAWFDDGKRAIELEWKNPTGALLWTPTAPLSIWDARASQQVAVTNLGYRILRDELDVTRSALHLCEACGRLEPAAWERPASSIPEFEPWQGLSHVCKRCAWETKEERRHRYNWMRATWQFRTRGWSLTKDEREELRCWRCFTCHEFKRLRNPWCCEACSKAWRRGGRPQGLDYRWFAVSRRALVFDKRPLSLSENGTDQGLSRVALYNGIREKELKLFDTAAAGLSWRARLQLFRSEVLMLAAPLEVTFRGSPTQIVDTMRQMVLAPPQADQTGRGTSSPQPAVDRIPRLAGAVSH